MLHSQKSFTAGVNLLTSDMDISPEGYRWLINARQRLGFIEPNNKHVEITNAPAGLKQGHIGLGNTHIIFVAGLAYFRIDGTETWTQIPGFSMDTVAPRYYIQAVPASSFNFLRKNNVDENAGSPIFIDSNFSVNGTPAGLLVQDNVNQPQVIFFNSTTQSFHARATNSYDDWTLTDHEYVPIGRQMMHKNGITFIVSRDGKSIFRSVSGRPLDFMVNVNPDGDKLTSELNGGASTTSFAFDFDEITCLFDTNADGLFIIATRYNIRLISFDYVRTIFGEPTFIEVALIKGGVVNQESMTEILGDYVFVDFENIKSFNAVEQLRNEGRNSIFSLQLSSLFHNIKQKEPCCCVFNNYALFYVKTVWGNLVAVYDTLHNKWVAFDLTTVDRIKQFAFVDTVTETKLFAITHHDELFQLYASEDDKELAQLMTRSIVPFADAEHKSQLFKPLFKGNAEEGEVTVIEYVDEQESARLDSDLENMSSGINYPVRPPVIPSNLPVMKNDTFNFKDGLTGKKIAFLVQWNTGAKLYGFDFTTSEIQRDSSLGQQNKILKETYLS